MYVWLLDEENIHNHKGDGIVIASVNLVPSVSNSSRTKHPALLHYPIHSQQQFSSYLKTRHCLIIISIPISILQNELILVTGDNTYGQAGKIRVFLLLHFCIQRKKVILLLLSSCFLPSLLLSRRTLFTFGTGDFSMASC